MQEFHSSLKSSYQDIPSLGGKANVLARVQLKVTKIESLPSCTKISFLGAAGESGPYNPFHHVRLLCHYEGSCHLECFGNYLLVCLVSLSSHGIENMQLLIFDFL